MPIQQEPEPEQPESMLPVPSSSLTIEEKRQVVYSSLLRYASEAIPLRERALNRAVAGALLGSTAEEPFRVGRIQENLRYRPDAPQIRTEVIQSTLKRLIDEGLVTATLLMTRKAYYQTPKGVEEVAKVISSTGELFDLVLRGVLRNTRHIFAYETGAAVFRKFVFQCFARFGQVIAKSVAGQIDHDTMLRNADVETAFSAAIVGRNLSTEAIDSLRARCYSFLRSQEPDDERLKFYLTQGYYFSQLLGLESAKFDPLNEQAFAGAVFYLDTNVLLGGISDTAENVAVFGEMVTVAKRISIELRVTRATINEVRRVAADRLSILKQIQEVIPEELAHRTEDQYIQGFLAARDDDPKLSPEMFLERFERITERIENELQLIIDDRTEDQIVDGRDVSQIARIMNEAAEETRGHGKSEPVLMHDVCHFVAVQDIREDGNKAWFLTRDRTLSQASIRLAGDDSLFSFQLFGFLQSISPFLTSVSEEQPFADVFSDFLAENIFPVGNLFEARELAIMAEFHADVMATPPELLVQAFDYVKSNTLKGAPYKRSDIPIVSLEIKKFLACSREDRLAALQAERERLAAESEAERQKRMMMEADKRQSDVEQEELRGQLNDTRQQVRDTHSKLDGIQVQMSALKTSTATKDQRRRAVYAAIGLSVGIFLWIFNNAILAILSQKLPALLSWRDWVLTGLNAIGALTLSIPAFFFIRHIKCRHELKFAAYAVISLVALVFSRVFTEDALNSMASYIEVAMLITALAAAALLVDRKG